ncbi:MAG: hypothetical protein MUE81_22260 [Thermoflexibacter sp.]|nr:hypothetical protein [Thermoflexibacter sp.]
MKKVDISMAKRKRYIDDEDEPRGKQYKEADLILMFNLNRIAEYETPLLKEWLSVDMPTLDLFEQTLFDRKLREAQNNIIGWSEEDLKMKFLAHIIELGYLVSGKNIVTYFDKTISATVEGKRLTVKSDFMIAKGLLDVYKTPYFHFQEYKPNKNPSGDSMAQLLEAFLIAQVKNKDDKPLYGMEVVGAICRFVVMEGKDYCVSNPYAATDREDLLKIIAILRKFREILETRLMID